jgi:hypothetical protein
MGNRSGVGAVVVENVAAPFAFEPVRRAAINPAAVMRPPPIRLKDDAWFDAAAAAAVFAVEDDDAAAAIKVGSTDEETAAAADIRPVLLSAVSIDRPTEGIADETGGRSNVVVMAGSIASFVRHCGHAVEGYRDRDPFQCEGSNHTFKMDGGISTR